MQSLIADFLQFYGAFALMSFMVLLPKILSLKQFGIL